jgi:hypothetical protein
LLDVGEDRKEGKTDEAVFKMDEGETADGVIGPAGGGWSLTVSLRSRKSTSPR